MARALGVTGVPFYVIDRRYGVSGAQPAETHHPGTGKGLGAAKPAKVKVMRP